MRRTRSSMKLGLGWGLAIAACALTLGLSGCGDDNHATSMLKDNNGSTLTTTAGQQLNESMFVGKWDLDGERTNTANGSGGVTDIPADITKDILGKGWRFERNGVLKTDQVLGSKTGKWAIEGANTLMIQEGGADAHRYEASFRDGFLYLKKPDGKYMVFERDKFFGL